MKNIRKVLAVLLAAALVAAVAGCGAQPAQPTQPDQSSQQTEASVTTGATPETSRPPAAKPLVTLKLRGTDVVPIQGVQDNEVAKEIEKELGIKIDYSLADPTKDKLALAGGDLPDIMQLLNTDPSYPPFSTYITGGSIIPLDDLLATNGPDITKNASQMVAFSKKYSSADTGKLYGLTANLFSNVGIPQEYNYIIGLTVRWDYYKEMGYPAITNPDDYLNVLAQMQKLHPKTDDGKKTYGISGWNDWGLWAYFVPYAFSMGYMNGNNFTLFDMKGSEVPMFTEEGGVFKDAMKFMYKANQMGLLDPEMFTQKNENFMAKNKNLQLLSVPALWWKADSDAAFAAKGIKDGGYYVVPGASPVVWENYGSTISGGLGDRFLCISKNCKYPDRAMDLLNFLYSYDGVRLLNSGVKGVHWDMENGKPEMKDDVLQAIKDQGNDYRKKTGIGLYPNLSGFSQYSRDTDGNLMYLEKTDKALKLLVTDSDTDFSRHYNVTYPGEAYKKLAESGKATIGFFDNTFQSLYPDQTNDLKMINGKVDNYTKSFVPKLIMAKSDDDFEKLWSNGIKDMNAMGLEQLVNWELEQNKTAIQKVAEIK